LNVEKARLDKMLLNNEIKSLVIALGTAISDSFDIEKLRYHKVIIMTDADTDGAHIRTLLLTLFYRYFRPVIEGGFLYIAQPPLFRLQLGKDVRYVYTPDQKDKAVVEMTAGKKAEANVGVQRYKGLGEMNPDQLWDTTMNPEFRTLLRVGIDDAQEADRLFEILMGDEVAPRKQFIQSNATLVRNLDIT
jgi:DNA gyrase subunit B